MIKLLAAADQAYLPALAIGAFAGLRTSEILALDWRDVRLADHTIKVVHRKARCAGTRLAPITENLVAWLSPLAKTTGFVWPRGREWKERERTITAAQNATAEAAGLLPWRHNGLRHAFCTFRVAATQDVPPTALEAGNSASTIFAHYRALWDQSWLCIGIRVNQGSKNLEKTSSHCRARETSFSGNSSFIVRVGRLRPA